MKDVTYAKTIYKTPLPKTLDKELCITLQRVRVPAKCNVWQGGVTIKKNGDRGLF